MKTAGVVVLYNPDEQVRKNINSYIDSLDILYVVDNSSVDNSKMFSGDKLVYLPNNDNLGIARALNIGAQRAIGDGYDWLLTMDQDSMFTAQDLDKLKAFLDLAEKEGSVCGGVSADYEKIGLVSPFHRTKFNQNEVLSGIDSPLMVMTSGNIINLKAYSEIGGFKDWLFIDTVDFDYCLNLRNHGYEIIRVNDV